MCNPKNLTGHTPSFKFWKMASKNKNAGLVGPAHSLFMHRWGATGLRPCPRRFRQILVTAYCVRKPHITRARFSNSFCRTGNAQPAISTRLTASRAASGETP